ncbi:MAG: hypothetical protein NTY53_23140, partial [Kiritimatiellaeota bacterium]|nr:hypothetical protein [Kiritimatiellota bacterium]
MNKRSVRGVALGLMLSVVVAQAQTATNFFYWTNTSATATTPWSSNNYWTNGYPVALGGTNVVLNFSATNAAYSSSNDFAGHFVLNGLTFGAGTV